MVSVGDVLERGETYMLDGIEVIDAVRSYGLDSRQISIHQPLANAGYPPRSWRNAVRLSETILGDPVALRQKATAGGNFLKSV